MLLYEYHCHYAHNVTEVRDTQLLGKLFRVSAVSRLLGVSGGGGATLVASLGCGQDSGRFA